MTKRKNFFSTNRIILLVLILLCMGIAFFFYSLFYSLHIAYSKHLIGEYVISADRNQLSIPFQGKREPYLFLDIFTPDGFESPDDVLTTYRNIDIIVDAIRNQETVYSTNTSSGSLSPVGQSLTWEYRSPRTDASMKINLPLEEIETGVDYLRVTLDEKETSLPRPLTVRLFYTIN